MSAGAGATAPDEPDPSGDSGAEASPSAAPPSAAPPAAGTAEALRRAGAHVLELLQLRLELLGTELEAEKLRVVGALVYGVAAVMLLTLAVLMLSATAVLLCPPGWRWLAILLLGLIDIALAWWCVQRARAELSPPSGIFAATAAELARDARALGH